MKYITGEEKYIAKINAVILNASLTIIKNTDLNKTPQINDMEFKFIKKLLNKKAKLYDGPNEKNYIFNQVSLL